MSGFEAVEQATDQRQEIGIVLQGFDALANGAHQAFGSLFERIGW